MARESSPSSAHAAPPSTQLAMARLSIVLEGDDLLLTASALPSAALGSISLEGDDLLFDASTPDGDGRAVMIGDDSLLAYVT